MLLRFLIAFCCLMGIKNPALGQENPPKAILWATDWSPNGKYIAVGGNSDSLLFLNRKGLTRYRSFPIKNTITNLRWHPSLPWLAVTTQFSTDPPFLLQPETGQKIPLEGVSSDGARGLEWNYDGSLLAIGDNDGQIHLYQPNGKRIKTFKHNNTKSITGLSWHPKQNLLVTVGDRIRLFDNTGQCLRTIKHRPEDILLLGVAWHPTGNFYVTGDYGHDQYPSYLQHWTKSGKCIRTKRNSKKEYRNLRWNKSGSRLATTSDALRIWDSDLKLLAETPSEHPLWGLTWNPEGNQLVTSSQQQQIKRYDSRAKVLQTIE